MHVHGKLAGTARSDSVECQLGRGLRHRRVLFARASTVKARLHRHLSHPRLRQSGVRPSKPTGTPRLQNGTRSSCDRTLAMLRGHTTPILRSPTQDAAALGRVGDLSVCAAPEPYIGRAGRASWLKEPTSRSLSETFGGWA